MSANDLRDVEWLAILLYLVILPLAIAAVQVATIISEWLQRRKLRRILEESRRSPQSQAEGKE